MQDTLSHQPTHHGWAVNVKDHRHYAHELPDAVAQDVYESVQCGFWADAEYTAREHGFRDVFSEGRMGGWAVPMPQPDEDDEQDIERFRAFERDLLAAMETYQDEADEALAAASARHLAEPAEAAYWAARDVETV